MISRKWFHGAVVAELLELAKKYAGEDRLALSQVALSEASLHALERKYEAARKDYRRDEEGLKWNLKMCALFLPPMGGFAIFSGLRRHAFHHSSSD
jgi:hypothetical protein